MLPIEAIEAQVRERYGFRSKVAVQPSIIDLMRSATNSNLTIGDDRSVFVGTMNGFISKGTGTVAFTDAYNLNIFINSTVAGHLVIPALEICFRKEMLIASSNLANMHLGLQLSGYKFSFE